MHNKCITQHIVIIFKCHVSKEDFSVFKWMALETHWYLQKGFDSLLRTQKSSEAWSLPANIFSLAISSQLLFKILLGIILPISPFS